MIIKIIMCLIGILKLYLYKLFNWKKLCINLKMAIHPSVSLELGKNSRLTLGKMVSIRKNVQINARNNAEIKIGNHSFLNTGCILTAHERIDIGDDVEFGPNVLIFDHDHKFKSGYKAKEFDCAEVKIGNNVWIGANTVILRGTNIGNDCVVGAGSVLKGSYEAGQLIYDNRQTIKKIINKK